MNGKPTNATSVEAETEAGEPTFESWLRKAVVSPTHQGARLPEKGQVIGGKYKIEAELGAGGMGAVFQATHVVSDKPVALKWMLRPASDERALQRFMREAKAAGRIDHPNVVDVYDIGQEGDASYLVMELLRGESLRKRLAREPLPPAELVKLLLPALRGVAAAHRHGVIHRDLKPDNIFLCQGPDGDARQAKVLDFGISMISSADHTAQTALTAEGTVLGTPSYMAPEQLESATDADARTDVYAFGVILYEALTGRLPFRADNYLGLAIAISKTQPTAPRALRPEIPVALERAVLAALQKDREKRPQTIAALIAMLEGPAAESGKVPRNMLGWGIALVLCACAALAWGWLASRQPTAAATTPPVAPAAPDVPHAVVDAPESTPTLRVDAVDVRPRDLQPPAPVVTAPVPERIVAPPKAAARKTAPARTAPPSPPPKEATPARTTRVGSIRADEL